jgi:crotonobetainyl-CoA:carnitine CoA-transferase CaiB-like acyl-CoA transferase
MRRGNGGFGGVPSQSFACTDRPLFLVAGNDHQFASLCSAIELAGLEADPRFATTAARIANRDELIRILGERFAQRGRDEWLARLDAHDVPAGPVNELPDVLSSAQVAARNLLVQTDGAETAPLSLLANPIRMSATPIRRYAAPPRMGEHTEQVLEKRLGKTPAEIATLRRSGAI